MVLGDPQGVVKQGNIRIYQRFRLSEIVDAGDIIVVAGNHENQTIAVGAVLLLLCLAMLQLLKDVIDLAKRYYQHSRYLWLIMSMPVREDNDILKFSVGTAINKQGNDQLKAPLLPCYQRNGTLAVWSLNPQKHVILVDRRTHDAVDEECLSGRDYGDC